MNKLRIIFMGTPDFAVASLDALIQNNQNIVAVITAPDRPAGRGRKMKQSAIKAHALHHNLNILQPTNLKDSGFIHDLKSLNADIIIVVAFRMLPKEVWKSARIGTFNLHASLLPDYRGAAPIHWAIVNGETKTGVTTFFINEKIDTGSILLQEELAISSSETVGELHDKLMTLGSQLVIRTVALLETDNYKTIHQPQEETKSAPKLNKENCRIDWHDSQINIYNKIRGLSPHPAAWSVLVNNDSEIEVKIYRSEKIMETHDFELGKILSSKKQLKVAVANGYISILEIKLAGKRKMDVKSLLNGYTFYDGAKLI